MMLKLEKGSKLLFFGDSITHGGRLLSMDGNHIIGHGYPDLISSKLGFENIENMPKFINKGISGNNISDLYSRLYNDVLKNKPDIISILVGINDILTGYGLPFKMITRKFLDIYRLMIADIRETLGDVKIIVCEPFFLELEPDREKPFADTPYAYCEKDFPISLDREFMAGVRRELTYMQEKLGEFAKENNLIYVPLQEKFFETAEKARPEYLVWDTIHPTVAGHQLIANEWLKTAEEALI